MTKNKRLRRYGVTAAIGMYGLIASCPVFADSANLAFTPQSAAVMVGDTIEIQLYVYSPDVPSPELSFVDALLIWDPSTLELLQTDPAGCSSSSYFLCGFLTNPDDLNEGSGTPNLPDNDGDALYSAFTNLSPPVIIPDAPGLLVTTFRFRALTESSGSTVMLMDMYPGGLSRTRVYAPANIDLTGDISAAMATVTICGTTPDSDGDGVADACDQCPGSDDHSDLDEDGIPDGCDPCPLMATPGVMQGDVDGSGLVELADVSSFTDVLLGIDTDTSHVAASDMNCDGQVNGLDISLLVALLLS